MRKERARNEPRANILRYILLLFQDFSRRTNLDQGKSLLGDARILWVSTEPGEYSKWPSESQNPANKGRSPRTFEKPRASSTSSLLLSLSRLGSSLPSLPFPCRLSTCWRHKSWPGPVVRTERSVCRCLDRRISRLWRPVSLLTPSFYLRFYGFFRETERQRERGREKAVLSRFSSSFFFFYTTRNENKEILISRVGRENSKNYPWNSRWNRGRESVTNGISREK